MRLDGYPLDMSEFEKRFMNTILNLQKYYHEMLLMGFTMHKNDKKCNENANNNHHNNNNNSNNNNNQFKINNNHNQFKKKIENKNDNSLSSHSNSNKTKRSTDECSGCGRMNHLAADCKLNRHPDFNHSKIGWSSSQKGKDWKKEGRDVLPWAVALNGVSWNPPEKPSSSANKRKKGESLNHLQNNHNNCNSNSCLICKKNDDDEKLKNTISCQILINLQISNTKPLDVEVLIDTGALQGNYVNKQIASMLNNNGLNIIKNNKQICSAINNTPCFDSLGSLEFYLTYLNEISNKPETIFSNFSVIDSPFEVIIGRPTIIKHELLMKLNCHFKIQKKENLLLKNNKINTNNTVGISELMFKESVQSLDGSSQMISSTLAVLNVRKQHMSTFLKVENSSDGFLNEDHHHDVDIIEFNNPSDSLDESLIPTKIFGSEDLKKKIIQLCTAYEDIFSTKLRYEPADLPAMEIKVDWDKWKTSKHRGPPRVQSTAKQNETLRQVNDMLESNVVQASQAAEYSHPLLTPKPDNSWRFCLDYRFLNDCCECAGWPIPNISLMLHRIGEHKSKIFGIMDLTKGYYQAPLSASSRILTAFITFMGVFEWLRVPMGIKGAPSYFQRVLSTVVLVGLLYVCTLMTSSYMLKLKKTALTD
jgi:hypothetical protein